MLMALLSMTFYKRVICHFLISGHSHMVPDRVISHVKRSFGTNDLYHPQDMIQKMSAVKSITGEFLDHNDPGRLLFIGWDKLLKEHLSPIPSIEHGYTKNHFFEFADGQVSMRHIVGSEVKYVHNYVQEGMGRIVRNSILSKIIGNVRLENANLSDMILPQHPVGIFPPSKIGSLTEKYFTIPADKLSYYPSLADLGAVNGTPLGPTLMANTRATETVESIKRKRGTDNTSTPGKAGRKKPLVTVLPMSKSILRFMQVKPPSNSATDALKIETVDTSDEQR